SATSKGFTHIWLETSTRLQAAVKLYERNGYRQPDHTSVYVGRCDRVYVKTLTTEPNALA
ncbi:MAG: GNAT family N-acetyltransferase, partial [Merismopedia sp. SIO2A8]|nr:GNAT family N-acetyltransferase [Merismopedia sp. SIO2A8]